MNSLTEISSLNSNPYSNNMVATKKRQTNFCTNLLNGPPTHIEHLARLNLERAPYYLRLIVNRDIHLVNAYRQTNVMPQSVIQAGAPVHHDLVLLGGVAQPERNVQGRLEQVHENVARVHVGGVLGEAVVVEAALLLKGPHAKADVEALGARVPLGVQMGVVVLEGHGHEIQVDAAVGEEALGDAVVGPLVAHALIKKY